MGTSFYAITFTDLARNQSNPFIDGQWRGVRAFMVFRESPGTLR